jgi:acyl-coenzyme A thioesterase PaaI-like protein
MKSSSLMFEYCRKRNFGSHLHFDEVPSVTPGLKTPHMLDVGRRTWKERTGDTLLSTFSLTSCHMGWHGIIHGGITSGIIDDLFAQYCNLEAPGLFALTKTLQIHFAKPVFPDEVLFARITKTSPTRERSNDGESRNKRLWVQGHIDAVRNNEAITVAKAEAIFILCKQLPEQPKVKPILPRMPQEVWDVVIEYLPSLTGKYAAQVFGFKLEEWHKKHADIWDMVLREGETWTPVATRQGLNPSLIGDDLHNLFNDPKQPAYICLSTGDKSANIRYDKMKLLASLREHHFNENGEVVFHDSNIILNIDEALYNRFFVTSTPKKLFSCQDNRLRSASLYWADSQHALRAIGPDDIVGIGERASTLKDVSYICGITLTHPKEMALRQRHQQCFQHPSCPPTYPVLSLDYKYNGDNILGWEWEDEL